MKAESLDVENIEDSQRFSAAPYQEQIAVHPTVGLANYNKDAQVGQPESSSSSTQRVTTFDAEIEIASVEDAKPVTSEESPAL